MNIGTPEPTRAEDDRSALQAERIWAAEASPEAEVDPAQDEAPGRRGFDRAVAAIFSKP
jgi:hypothetical protein